MLWLRRVVGRSMFPGLPPGRLVVCRAARRYRPGQIVIAQSGRREIIKRLAWQSGGAVLLQGDHPCSSDSLLPRQAVKGRLLFKLWVPGLT